MQKTLIWVLSLLAGVCLTWPRQIRAEKVGFERFCASWMQKLAERESVNLRTAQVRQRGERFILEYTGYDSKPTRCETRATGVPENPLVGRLVYHELLYRKTSAELASIFDSVAEVIWSTEVLELFRYDGSRWLY
jgi:hypothetical protein